MPDEYSTNGRPRCWKGREPAGPTSPIRLFNWPTAALGPFLGEFARGRHGHQIDPIANGRGVILFGP